VRIENIRIRSWVNPNNDGIDLDSCRDVTVRWCGIDTRDDAICLKSTMDRACRDVLVENCVLSSGCGAMKLGTESYGDFKNLRFRNCVVVRAGLCGIKILNMDGATIDNVRFSDIRMEKVAGPIFIRLGARRRTYGKFGCEPKGAGIIRNIHLKRLTATVSVPQRGMRNYFTRELVPPRALSGILITGIPGYSIQNVVIEDCRFEFAGGGTLKDRLARPAEQIAEYPEHFYFGVLPVHGFYLRHVRNLRLRNVQVRLRRPDLRPVIFGDDVDRAIMAISTSHPETVFEHSRGIDLQIEGDS
jgi:hypothetical protein